MFELFLFGLVFKHESLLYIVSGKVRFSIGIASVVYY